MEKTAFLMILSIFFSCQKDVKVKAPVKIKRTDSVFYKIGPINSKSINTSVINYNADSLFYNLKNPDNDKVTTFLIVKKSTLAISVLEIIQILKTGNMLQNTPKKQNAIIITGTKSL